MSFCAHCGKPLAPGASFCTACGASLPPAAAPLAAPGPAPGVAAQPAPPPAARVRPLGVTIIGVMMLVAAGALVLGGLAMLLWVFVAGVLGGAMDQAFPWMPIFGIMGAILVIVALVALVVLLALAALTLATGIGVLRGRSWGWGLTIALMGLVALNGLGALAAQEVDGVFGVAVAGLVIWYFFQPDVKRWFGRAP